MSAMSLRAFVEFCKTFKNNVDLRGAIIGQFRCEGYEFRVIHTRFENILGFVLVDVRLGAEAILWCETSLTTAYYRLGAQKHHLLKVENFQTA